MKRILLIGFSMMFMCLPQSLQASTVFSESFSAASFGQSGWAAIPNGQGEFQLADVAISLIPTSPSDPSLSDGRGLVVTAERGEGALLYGPVVRSDDDLVLLRVSVFGLGAGASIAMGALDVSPNGNIATTDNSGNFLFESDSGFATQDFQQLISVFRAKRGAFIPVLQVALNPDALPSSVTVMFDNFDGHRLDDDTVSNPVLRELLRLDGTEVPPTPTPVFPTPTPTPTPSPTMPPAADFVIDAFIGISPDDDVFEAGEPDVAHDRDSVFTTVAADQTLAFPDILLRDYDASENTITDPVTVNQTFEDTTTRTPDVEIDFGGTRHIVWSDNRSVEKLFSVYLTPFNSFGSRIVTSDLEVNRLFVDTNTDTPALAVRDNGDIAVIWKDDRNFLTDIFVRRVRWSGTSYQLLDDSDILVNNTFENTNATDPDIAISDEGRIVAVWSDNRTVVGNSKRNDIFARVFTMSTALNSDGQFASDVKEVRVSDDDTVLDNAARPRIATTDNTFLVVWENTDPSTNTGSIRATLLDRDGDVLVPEFLVDSGDASNRAHSPSVAVWSEGQYVITWADDADNSLQMLFYDAAQNLYLTDPILLVESVFDVEQTRLAADDDNRLVMVWDETLGGLREASGLSLSVNAGDLQQMSVPTRASELRGGGIQRFSIRTTEAKEQRSAKPQATSRETSSPRD